MRRQSFVATLLVAATLIVYAQVSRFEFVRLDDGVYVSENRHLKQSHKVGGLGWIFAFHTEGNWIPMTWLSLWLDAQLVGLRPGGYHLTNVLIHAANSVLLFAFLVRATQNQPRSAFVAALFALHPLHVESVAWISERKDVLSIFFGLLSLLAYAKYGHTRVRRSLFVCYLFFILSLLSKATLVTLPFVFLLLDFWPLRRLDVDARDLSTLDQRGFVRNEISAISGHNENRAFSFYDSRIIRLIAEKVPFFLGSAVFSVIAVVAQKHSEAVIPLTVAPLTTRILNAFVVYVTYLGRTIYPHDLAIFYPYSGVFDPGRIDLLAWLAAGGAAALLVAISIVAIVWIQRFPFLLVGWLWYLGTLVPMIGIVQVGYQQMADRYTYFPLIGIFIAVAWLIGDWAEALGLPKWLLSSAAITSLALLVATSFRQVSYWHDSVTLFRHAIDCGSDSALARHLLGSALIERGDITKGMALIESAIQMSPNIPDPHFSLGVALQANGRQDAAAKEFEAALAIRERDAAAHNNLGVILWRRHKTHEAMRHFRRAIEIDAEYAPAYTNLGALCVESGDYGTAITYSEHGLRLDAALLQCRRNIAFALVAQGKLDEATKVFQDILDIVPNDEQARLALQQTLEIKRRGPRRH